MNYLFVFFLKDNNSSQVDDTIKVKCRSKTERVNYWLIGIILTACSTYLSVPIVRPDY